MSAPSAAALLELGSQLLATKRYMVGVFCLLVYDHVLTFPEEVKYVWRTPWSFVKGLFFILRYGVLLSFVVIIYAWFSFSFPFDICQHYVKFEGYVTLVFTCAAELTLTLRMYALYSRNKWILGFLLGTNLAQFIFGAWLFGRPLAGALPLPPIPVDAFHACTFVGDPTLPLALDSLYLWLGILFDLSVCVMTIVKAIQNRNKRVKSARHTHDIFTTLIYDGLLYFVVIFSANMVWTIMLLIASPGIKFINSHPSLIFTTVMINRLTMSLRSSASQSGAQGQQSATNSFPMTNMSQTVAFSNNSAAPMMAHRSVKANRDVYAASYGEETFADPTYTFDNGGYTTSKPGHTTTPSFTGGGYTSPYYDGPKSHSQKMV